MQKLKNSRNFGNNLRILRTDHQFTQDIVVAKLGILGISISRNAYSRYETGELNVPIEVLIALRQIYSCSYDAFFKGLIIE